MKLYLVLGGIFCLWGRLKVAAGTDRYCSFTVYYTDKAPSTAFESFDLVVFDSEYHPVLNTLADRGKTLLGYLSLGEVENHRAYFLDVKKEFSLRKTVTGREAMPSTFGIPDGPAG